MRFMISPAVGDFGIGYSCYVHRSISPKMGGMEVAIQSIAALAPFARFFRIVFISGSSHKELLWTYFTAEGMLACLASKFRGSIFLGNNLFDRSHRQVDEETIRCKWGMAVVNRVVAQ